MKYYAVWDLQTNEYIRQGYNLTNKREVKKEMWDYIEYDTEDEDRKAIKRMPLNEMLDMWSFRLDQSGKPFPEINN